MPTGKLKIIGTSIKQKGEVAVYVTITLVDENGHVFKMKTSSFLFDLQKEADL